MARVRPFRGIRYAPGRVRLERVLAPPYDVISPAEREAYARDPHSIVHLELPLDERGKGSRYEAAAARLRAWLAEGVLARDAEPALYPYRQRFEHGGRSWERRGFLGLVELLPPGAQSGIHPHEYTLRGPREDRLRLVRAAHANLSPVFLLYEDPGGTVRERLESAPHARLGGAVRTPWETEEELAAVRGPAARAIAGAISDTALVFADGHHRYESALQHYQELLGAPGTAAHLPRAPDHVDEGSAAYALAAFVECGDPGLLALPTHRVVRRGAAARGEAWEHVANRCFARLRFGHEAGESEARGEALAWLARAAHDGACRFVAAWAGEDAYEGLELRRAERAELFAGPDPPPPALQEMDVTVLHALLERGLGITPEAVRERHVLSYTRDADEALAAVAGGEPAAFLVNGMPVPRIAELAAAGHRLPQKTTYFHPKLTSGWLLHGHPEDVGE